MRLELVSASQRIDAKAFATLQVRAALLGCMLVRIDDDRGREVFIVSRAALSKELPSAEAVDAWLKAAGGPKA